MARNSRTGRNRQISTLQKILQTDTKKVICILLIFFLILLIAFTSTKLFNKSNSSQAMYYDTQKVISLESTTNKDITNDAKNFSLCAIGDVMCHNTQYLDAYNNSTGEYDFSYVFDDIKNYTQSPDITVASLETSFAGEEIGYSNYPTFNSPDNLAYCLRNIGIDVISTAGNHCLDMGFSGLSRTIDVLDTYGISHMGTYKTKEASQEILYKNVNDVKIAFVNYTYGTNRYSYTKQ